MSTKLVTFSEILTNKYFTCYGKDDAEQIKYFIKNAIEQWNTSYVLFIGDIYSIPMRTIWIGSLNVITDLYYADVYAANGSFCSWDSNNNGVYGEYWHDGKSDDVDLYPDVHVGRLPCRNACDVFIMVKKIIAYETKTYGQDWFKTLILAGGDTHPNSNGFEGETIMEDIVTSLPGFSPVKLYTSTETFNPRTINHAFNKGAGFLAYAGHGFAQSIATHPPGESEWIRYRHIHTLGLWNFNKLPIVFLNACSTGKLDYSLGETIGVDKVNITIPCFAWELVKKPFGGAIASVAATRGTYDSGILPVSFFASYHESIQLGEMFSHAQEDFLSSYSGHWKELITFSSYTLIGDPSLIVGGYHEEK